MINKELIEQLHKCKVASIPAIDDNTDKIIIKCKSTSDGANIRISSCYLVELSDLILNPSDQIQFHYNWNNGCLPEYKYMKCECIDIVGEYMKIYGVGYDYSNKKDLSKVWVGWLPLSQVTILEEL